MGETKELVAIARNPAQMQVAQQQLIGWAESKIGVLKTEMADVEENIAIARKSKWRVTPFERRLNGLQKEVEFYEKIGAALKAGYVIVPNFDNLDVFAVRTTRKNPRKNRITTSKQWSSVPKDTESDRPALGEGHYVDAECSIKERPITVEGRDGKTEEKLVRWNDAFAEVDFPFRLAKPEILDATSQAMVAKIFDDIGILPARKVRGQDPMVIGRIWKRSGGYSRKTISFLIAWFVDTRDL